MTGPSRRTFLLGGLATAALGGGLTACSYSGEDDPEPSPPPEPSPTPDPTPTSTLTPGFSFGIITDTHANAEVPERIADLTRSLQHLDGRNPSVVLHCGDITDHGVEAEFDTFEQSLPGTMKPKLRAVPGNHETSWDASGLATYRRRFGDSRLSFAAGGFQFIGLDPLVSLDREGYFGPELLSWIRAELDQTPKDRPIIMFLHFPVDGRSFYVNDADRFLEVIADYPVRAIFAGHRHGGGVTAFNGFTQVVIKGAIKGPYYGWARLSDDGQTLLVSEVTVSAAGAPAEKVIAQIPCFASPTSNGQGQVPIGISQSEQLRRVGVTVPDSAGVVGAETRLHPQAGAAAPWTPLRRGTTVSGISGWSAIVDTTPLPPGGHRLLVHAERSDGTIRQETLPFTLPGAQVRQGWELRMRHRIRAGLRAIGGQVIVASVGGEVSALTPTGDSNGLMWRQRLGPVYRPASPSPDPDRSLILLSSADGQLYALDRISGQKRWATDLGAPSLAHVSTQIVDGEPVIFTCAGGWLHALDLEGKRRWKAALRGIFTGQVASNEAIVTAGSGDGSIHSFNALDGKPLWTVSATDEVDTYRRLIYGPWATVLVNLGADALLVCTTAGARAIDRATGKTRWNRPGNFIYTPARGTRHGLLLTDENGTMLLLDPVTGTPKWETAQAVRRGRGSAPIPNADQSLAWFLSHSGQLTVIDLATGTATPMLQVSDSLTYSTPAAVSTPAGPILVCAGQDGVVRGIQLTPG